MSHRPGRALVRAGEDLGPAAGLRRLAEHVLAPDRFDQPAALEDRSDAPSDALLRKELRHQIAAAIDELPEGARETLVLREVDGLSYAEIAEALGIPKGTVMSRLHYARKRVQEILVEAGAVEKGLGPDEPKGNA